MILLLVLLTFFVGCLVGELWCDTPENVPVFGTNVANHFYQAPQGFCIREFAAIRTPRTLEFAENGDVLIGSPSAGTPGGAPTGVGGIYLLSDDNFDGVADDPTNIFFQAGSTVHGIKIIKDRLYYSLSDQVNSVPFTVGEKKIRPLPDVQMVADLGNSNGDRWTHTIAYDKVNDTIYVSTGHYNEGLCGASQDPRVGAVLKIGENEPMDGTIMITRCRNPMYLTCVPWGCYAMELTGDSWGRQGGTEKLIKIEPGKVIDIGFPCCIKPNVPNSNFPSYDCSDIDQPVAEFRVQDTPFGFDWDVQEKFPGAFKGALFIAFHGSFSGWTAAGLGYMKWDPVTHRPLGKENQFFPDGFGHQGKIVQGRVADAKFHPDGRLFLCDDVSGRVWWIAPTTLAKNFTLPQGTTTTKMSTVESSTIVETTEILQTTTAAATTTTAVEAMSSTLDEQTTTKAATSTILTSTKLSTNVDQTTTIPTSQSTTMELTTILTTVDQTDSSPISETDDVVAATPSQNADKWIIGIVAVLAFVVLLGVGLFLCNKTRENKKAYEGVPTRI